MKRFIAMAAAAAALGGCGDGPHDRAAHRPGEGRYLGIGIYPVDRLWQELAGGQSTADGKAATLADDSQVIVVVDSMTGEIRQCGNLSGRCIAANPWRGAASPLPAAIGRHAGDLESETTAVTARRTPAEANP